MASAEVHPEGGSGRNSVEVRETICEHKAKIKGATLDFASSASDGFLSEA
jgi:hypothetical protein